MSDLTKEAMSLYKPPFKYIAGYINDADGRMVADQGPDNIIMQIRGWGRIQYKNNPEALQDEIGRLCAEALTNLWSDPPITYQEEENESRR